MKTVIKKEFTQEEAEQMAGMFNWANNNDDVMSIELHSFKQYHKDTKDYHTVFEISSKHWVNDAWTMIRAKGESVIEAMGNYGIALTAKELG